jgi:hypothetical protein
MVVSLVQTMGSLFAAVSSYVFLCVFLCGRMVWLELEDAMQAQAVA